MDFSQLKYKKKILKLKYFYIFLLIALSVRLAFLQISPSEKVISRYQNQQRETIGDSKYYIYDTNGKDLMRYNKKYVLVIDSKPFKLNNYEETLEDLMALNFIMKEEKKDFNYTDVMKNEGKTYFKISESTYNKIHALSNVKGIYTYTYDEVEKSKAWELYNILSNIDKEENGSGSLQEILKNYVKDNKKNTMDFYVNESAVYAKAAVSNYENNRNIKLTIDKELEDKIRAVLARDEFKDIKNIGVILMESKTGKVRALAQKDETAANVNLGMQMIGYEPGSIFKVITLATALEEGLINLNDSYSCIKGKDFNCWTIHGTETVEQALVNSCNEVFSSIGIKVGYDKLMEYCTKLGLFKQVLNLNSEDKVEASGIKPPVENSMRNFAIGQSMTATPIQMIGAINGVINDGVYVKPYIVDSIIDKNDNVVKKFETEEKRIYSETTSSLVKNSMKAVVKDGTGKNAYVDGVNLGGKTGTGTTSKKNITHGWFVGYFTLNGVQYTMSIVAPELESKEVDLGAGNTASPVFKSVLEELIKGK